MTKILVFGDSIAWGAFDLEKGGWVERLKAHYLNMRPEVKYYVYNFGISSDDTGGILFRLEKQMNIIEKIEPDNYLFIFSIGKNDARGVGEKSNRKIKIEDYRNNLMEMINIAKNYSDEIFFLGYSIVDEEKTKPWKNAKDFWENKNLEEYEERLRDICNSKGVHYIKIRDVLSKNDLHDGLHPNTEGHRKIFEKVKAELNKFLGTKNAKK